METILFPRAVHLSFVTKTGRYFVREFSAQSLHSFEVGPYGMDFVKLVAANGDFAPGVDCSYFERLPAEYYSWVKFKSNHTLATAKRGASGYWVWQTETVDFVAHRVYAIKILPQDDGQTQSCNFATKNGKIFLYVDRGYFSVVSEKVQPSQPRVLEAFPPPIPGVQRDCEPGVWDVPMDYDSIPITHENHIFSRFKHATIKPVAALRLDFDVDRNPLYRCSYFGPALK